MPNGKTFAVGQPRPFVDDIPLAVFRLLRQPIGEQALYDL